MTLQVDAGRRVTRKKTWSKHAFRGTKLNQLKIPCHLNFSPIINKPAPPGNLRLSVFLSKSPPTSWLFSPAYHRRCDICILATNIQRSLRPRLESISPPCAYWRPMRCQPLSPAFHSPEAHLAPIHPFTTRLQLEAKLIRYPLLGRILFATWLLPIESSRKTVYRAQAHFDLWLYIECHGRSLDPIQDPLSQRTTSIQRRHCCFPTKWRAQ